MKTAYNATLICEGDSLLNIQNFVNLLKAGELKVTDVFWNELMNAPMIYVELRKKRDIENEETTMEDYQGECRHKIVLSVDQTGRKFQRCILCGLIDYGEVRD